MLTFGIIIIDWKEMEKKNEKSKNLVNVCILGNTIFYIIRFFN